MMAIGHGGYAEMGIRQAVSGDFDAVTRIVHTTIREVYPRYYPEGVVRFFLAHHSDAAVMADILAGNVFLVEEGECAAGTVTLKGCEIGRLFVLPARQGKGLGTALLDFAERVLSRGYGSARLDASLPAKELYLKRGYVHVSSGSVATGSGDVLCYDVMEKRLFSPVSKIHYNGRTFVSKMNSGNGEVDSRTVFRYSQEGAVVWGEYAGGEIVRGHLLGSVSGDGVLDFHYQHVNVGGSVRIGRCRSVPCLGESGKLELRESWQWLNGDCSAGESVVVER